MQHRGHSFGPRLRLSTTRTRSILQQHRFDRVHYLLRSLSDLGLQSLSTYGFASLYHPDKVLIIGRFLDLSDEPLLYRRFPVQAIHELKEEDDDDQGG